eukprot:scaffold118680_cov32-Tisochrysis_lutea.AAC.2
MGSSRKLFRRSRSPIWAERLGVAGNIYRLALGRLDQMQEETRRWLPRARVLSCCRYRRSKRAVERIGVGRDDVKSRPKSISLTQMEGSSPHRIGGENSECNSQDLEM